MTKENWALFFHLLGAFLLVAGVTVAGFSFEAARRRRSPGEIALLLGVARAAVPLVGLGSALVLVFGLWLVHIEGIGYRTGWVQAAIGLFVVMMVLGGLGGRAPRRARELAETGEDTPELRRALNDRTALVLNYGSAVIALTIIVLMVFKP
jgi:uncharacterized membrane protein